MAAILSHSGIHSDTQLQNMYAEGNIAMEYSEQGQVNVPCDVMRMVSRSYAEEASNCFSLISTEQI